MEDSRDQIIREISEYISEVETYRGRDEAIKVGHTLLSERFLYCFEFLQYRSNRNGEVREVKQKKSCLKAVAELYPIEYLNFSSRIYNSFTRAGEKYRIRTVADLIDKTDQELRWYRNVGNAGIKEIRKKLERFVKDWEEGTLPAPPIYNNS